MLIISAASHAKARRAALEGLPQDLRSVSKMLKVVIKAHLWPSKASKPSSYMVDVVMKFLWEGGPPRVCIECGDMMLRSCTMGVTGVKCTLCKETLGFVSFVCFKCDSRIPAQISQFNDFSKISERLCNLEGCKKQQSDRCLNLDALKIFQPTREQYESRPYQKFGMMYNNIHWSYDNVHPPSGPRPFGMLQWIVYFFMFCSHFERVKIPADFTEIPISEDVSLPYIQDPGCKSNNIVERFDYRPFLKFCWDLVDNSGDGFIHISEYLEPRRTFFSPFATIFALGIKIAVNLYLPQYEDIFVVFVDPRWSFYALFNAFGCRGDRTQRRSSNCDCPNVLMHNPSIASIMLFSASESITVTPDKFHLPMITYRVSFGSYVYLFEGGGSHHHGDVSEPDDAFIISNLAASFEEESLRQHRFEWTSSDMHPQILHDNQTGAICHFHPSLNKCRAFGPDFYY